VVSTVDDKSLSDALALAARALNSPKDRSCRLGEIARVAHETLPGIDAVGISVAHRDGTVETLAATGELVHQLDNLQYELGQGPCLHAIKDDPVVVVEHAQHEQRWPEFIKRALALGLRSQLGVRLYLDERSRGGLNLYSTSSDTIDPETEHVAELFGAHAAMALGRERDEENLHKALESRTVIGVALGMVMERYGLSRDSAFAFLTRLASTRETKLREVAAEIVASAEIVAAENPSPASPGSRPSVGA
jgi:GAF domain-containing protein